MLSTALVALTPPAMAVTEGRSQLPTLKVTVNESLAVTVKVFVSLPIRTKTSVLMGSPEALSAMPVART